MGTAPPPVFPRLTRGAWARRVTAIVVATLVLVELGVRIATHSLFSLDSPDDRERYRDVDALVGYVPKSGVSIHPRKGNFDITTQDHGTRSNGNAPPTTDGSRTLVVGDSFAFGDDVNDGETWPAQLERRLERRVINAGVPGYGLDQAVLRASQLVPVYTPDTVLVSFIPHDVLRCEMSRWSGNSKPYFEVEADTLIFKPATTTTPSPTTRRLKQALSKSVTLDAVFPMWLHGAGPDQVAHHRGREVACLLMDRLVALRVEHHLRVVVIAQPQRASSTSEERELKDAVLACAERAHLGTIDLFSAIDAVPTVARNGLFQGHMTPDGNRLVASEVVAYLARQRTPPAP